MTDYTGKGYWGKCLEVDLSNLKITVTDRHMQYLDDYAGGRALGMKMLWEALKDKPGYDPMGPDAPVMFIAGPCTGSSIAFGSRYIVVNKSALTMPLNSPYETPGGIGFGSCGGHFGPNLKWCGFDMVYITGEVPDGKKYVLKIDDNAAELVDAECWGMDVPECQEWAKNKYGVQYATAFFGPAAENGVRWADVAGDTGRASGRSGASVSLAKRGLKGLIAFGTQMPPMADMEKYLELRQNYYNALYAWSGLAAFRRWGTLLNCTTNGWNGYGAAKNHEWCEAPRQVSAGLKYYHFDYVVRHRTCVGCITRCMKFGVVKNGKYKGTIYEGPDYEGGIMNGHNWLIPTGEEIAYLAEYVESQGMDCITAGAVVGFILEAVEKGYLDAKADLKVEGLTWGATDPIHQLIEHIIYDHDNAIYDEVRRGCIPLVRWIVANKGKDFKEVYDITAQCKNAGFAAWQVAGNNYQAINYSVSTRGACHMIGMMRGSDGGNTVVRDMGVYCQFGSQGGVSGYAYFETLNCAMGRNLTAEQWNAMGTRVTMLERCFNVNEGFRAKPDDVAPEKVFAVTPEEWPAAYAATADDPILHPGRQLQKEWYDENWLNHFTTNSIDPETGCPGKGKLQECGLEDVIPYMEKALALTGQKMMD